VHYRLIIPLTKFLLANHIAGKNNGKTKSFITDVNECATAPSICGPNSICSNTIGGYNCSCRTGFIIFLYVDECKPAPSICGPNSICSNTIGGYNCSCRTGFTVTNPALNVSTANPCTGEILNTSLVLKKDYKVISNVLGLWDSGEPSQEWAVDQNTSRAQRRLIQEVKKDPTTTSKELQASLASVKVSVHDSIIKRQKLPAWNSSIEKIGESLSDEPLSLTTSNIQLNRTNFTNSFHGTFGQSSNTEIDILNSNTSSSITIIVFSALQNILPVRNATHNESILTDTKIGSNVVMIKLDQKTDPLLSLSFDTKNNSLSTPQCVFWNFSLLDGVGGWDSNGCEANQSEKSGYVVCHCNHTTAFSILMSPFPFDDPALEFITYIGVAISMGSLVLCLLIEILIWKSMTKNDTSYMRHLSTVNLAASLLIADICFIIGAGIVKKGQDMPVRACTAVTFFMHFFYLALFFWMLLSALLLLYRTLVVFSRMSRSVMMAIAFIIGYGAPLLIAVITVAVTAGNNGYIQEAKACWLNWDKTKALLAFVIPALTIVVINILVLAVVLYKMLRRGVAVTTHAEEKHTMLVIARCVGILTPLFGLTWGFGIGTMVSTSKGIHIVFATLNSLQGFFILVFGTLLDNKVCMCTVF
uniref:Adhesion G protein-coupled receptor F5 n=2 Tax=Astyanax mexicanus TaxID=7994 RepID=A0A8B9J568_ASTMX